MRKIILFIACISLCATQMKSQQNELYSRGVYGITGFPGGGFGGGVISMNLRLRPSIFIADKLNLGVDFGGSFIGNYYTGLYANPSLKYYLLSKKISPVLTAGYKFTSVMFNEEKHYESYPNLGMGVSFNPGGNFFIETGVEYNFLRSSTGFDNLNHYLTIGFYLNRGKKKMKP